MSVTRVGNGEGWAVKGPIYVTNSSGVDVQIVDENGNIVAPVTTTDLTTTGNTTIGNAATDTLTITAVIVGSPTFLKETNHAVTVAATTTAATAGGNLTFAAGAGATTGAGGVTSLTGGASGAGATGNGGAASLVGGAALSTDGTGGAAAVTGGVATGTGVGGAVSIVSGASGGASGTAGAVNVDSGSAAGGTAGAVTIGVTNAASITIGRAGVRVNMSAGGIKTIQAVTQVNDTTPTAAELTSAFGSPATLGRGFIGLVDDNDGDTNGYLAFTSDASWYFLKFTKAS